MKLEATETKTRRARLVPLSARTIKILKEYLKETKEFENEYLFLTYEGKPLSADTVRWSLRQIGRRQKLQIKEYHRIHFVIQER